MYSAPIIRPMTAEHCAAVAHIVTVCWQQTYRGMVNDAFLDGLPGSESRRAAMLAQQLEAGASATLVLERDGEAAGFVKFGVSDTDPLCGEITALYLLPHLRGGGHGRTLAQAAMAQLRQRGCKQLIIGCLEGNPACGFYRRIGGVPAGKREFSLPGQTLQEQIFAFDL